MVQALDRSQRQAFVGSVQTLQALCGDCHSEKTLGRAQFTILPGDVSERRVDVVRCRRGWLTPFLCPAEPVDGVLGFVKSCSNARHPPESVAARGARLAPKGFAGRDDWTCWDHIVLGILRGATGRGNARQLSASCPASASAPVLRRLWPPWSSRRDQKRRGRCWAAAGRRA